MSEIIGKEKKKETVKDIIKQLHRGLSPEEAKKKLIEEVGSISSVEIADIEQSLINEGVSPDEIKKFCNVHALIFETTLAKSISEETSEAHPVNFFKEENRETEKITEKIKRLGEKAGEGEPLKLSKELKSLLLSLKDLEVHYTRKEQLLFPFLEKYKFMGPTQVMWGKDNEIRDLLKKAIQNLKEFHDDRELRDYYRDYVTPLVEEVEGMIFKEENILFPTSLEKLSGDDWVAISKESEEVGYAFGVKPEETEKLIRELKQTIIEEPEIKDSELVSFPTGEVPLKELMYILNTLPVDVTFIDKEDTVRYFTDNSEKIFVRPRSVIGRKVQNCHPPQSLDTVEKILASFKEGKRDWVDFWINYKERFIYIRFFAVCDTKRRYLGTIEVVQDITDIKKLEGEKRLLDEKF